jgi:hypothetical protein
MFTIIQRIGAIPRNPVRRSHHDRGSCSGPVPAGEKGTAGTGRFTPWLARARNARLLTEGL